MTQASPLSTAAFEAIVAVMLTLWLLATRRTASGDARLSPAVRGLVVLVTIVVPAGLARAHLLDRYSPLPAPALVMVGVVAMLTLAMGLSSAGARLARTLPLTGLVGFQAFRFPLELVLHRLYIEGALPVQMTWAGRNFDIVSGILAIIVAVGVWKGWAGRTVVWLWNALGLALLLNVVAVAVLSTPTPFRVFTDGPPVLVPSTYPWVWLATFLVPAALFGHVLVFRTLAARARSAGVTS